MKYGDTFFLVHHSSSLEKLSWIFAEWIKNECQEACSSEWAPYPPVSTMTHDKMLHMLSFWRGSDKEHRRWEGIAAVRNFTEEASQSPMEMSNWRFSFLTQGKVGPENGWLRKTMGIRFSTGLCLTFLAQCVREEALTFCSHAGWKGAFSLLPFFIQDICGRAAEYSNTSSWPLSTNSLSHNEMFWV